MKCNIILNINPKGDIVCYDKKGILRDDLNIYHLTKQDQLKAFGEILIYDEKKNIEIQK